MPRQEQEKRREKMYEMAEDEDRTELKRIFEKERRRGAQEIMKMTAAHEEHLANLLTQHVR